MSTLDVAILNKKTVAEKFFLLAGVAMKTFFTLSYGAAELANVLVIHARDLGSNLDTDRKYFLILLVSHLDSNL